MSKRTNESEEKPVSKKVCTDETSEPPVVYSTCSRRCIIDGVTCTFIKGKIHEFYTGNLVCSVCGEVTPVPDQLYTERKFSAEHIGMRVNPRQIDVSRFKHVYLESKVPEFLKDEAKWEPYLFNILKLYTNKAEMVSVLIAHWWMMELTTDAAMDLTLFVNKYRDEEGMHWQINELESRHVLKSTDFGVYGLWPIEHGPHVVYQLSRRKDTGQFCRYPGLSWVSNRSGEKIPVTLGPDGTLIFGDHSPAAVESAKAIFAPATVSVEPRPFSRPPRLRPSIVRRDYSRAKAAPASVEPRPFLRPPTLRPRL